MMIIGQMHNLLVTGMSTWCLYYLQDCMYSDKDNGIPNCDCKPRISYYSTDCLWLSFAVLFSCLLSYFAVFAFELAVSQFAILLQLQLQALILYLARAQITTSDPHICRGGQVLTTANSNKYCALSSVINHNHYYANCRMKLKFIFISYPMLH